MVESSVDPKAIRGWIDVAQRTRIAGWAMRGEEPSSRPLELSLWIAATAWSARRLLTTVLANGYRADRDLRATRYEGRFGFDVDLREHAIPSGSFLIDVREASTGAPLPNTPHLIPSVNFKPRKCHFVAYEVNGRPVCSLPGDVLAYLPEQDGKVSLNLPAGSAGVMLCAPTRQVAGDVRVLGVCVSAVTLDGKSLDLTGDVFRFGFHEYEGEPGRAWRWTSHAAFVGIGSAVHVRAQASVLSMNLSGLIPWHWEAEKALNALHLSVAWRSTTAAYATLPFVGRNFLTPPMVPPHRLYHVRPAGEP